MDLKIQATSSSTLKDQNCSKKPQQQTPICYTKGIIRKHPFSSNCILSLLRPHLATLRYTGPRVIFRAKVLETSIFCKKYNYSSKFTTAVTSKENSDHVHLHSRPGSTPRDLCRLHQDDVSREYSQTTVNSANKCS
jgi:hypothetical protein